MLCSATPQRSTRGSREPSRPRRRATYTRPHGVRHLFAAYDLSKDKLYGQKGKDSLLGLKGKDTLKGGGGKDLCKGGKGRDTASKCEVEKSI